MCDKEIHKLQDEIKKTTSILDSTQKIKTELEEEVKLLNREIRFDS